MITLFIIVPVVWLFLSIICGLIVGRVLRRRRLEDSYPAYPLPSGFLETRP